MRLRFWSAFVIACGCGGTAPQSEAPPLALTALTVTMKTLGQAKGSVTATNGASTLLDCTDGACNAHVPAGSTVTLTAAPAGPEWIFIGWSADCTGAAPTCVVTMTKPVSVGAQFRPAANFVFESSAALSMPFGATASASQAAADDVCAERAAAAGLPGHFVAWLSTSTTSAIAKLGNANGWVRTDGRPFANTQADLVAGKIFYPPSLSESGKDVGHTTLFSTATGTGPDGNALPGSTCDDWTSTAGTTHGGGVPSGGSRAWTAGPATVACSGPFPVYCFETSFNAPVAAAATGRLAFVSKGTFRPGAGHNRASADAICQSEAQAAGLPGPFTDYLALLAVAGESPIARFSTGAGTLPWVRPDGVQLVANASDIGSDTLLAPLDVAADGTYVPGGITWTGAIGQLDLPADASSTCDDWGSNAANSGGGQIEYSIFWANEYRNSLTCLGGQQVFCVQK